MGSDIVTGIVTGVAVAGIAGAVAILRRRASLLAGQHRPLDVDIRLRDTTSWHVVLPEPFVPPDAAEQAAVEAHPLQWLRKRGAVDWEWTEFDMNLRNPTRQNVVIDDIRVKILSRSAPLTAVKVESAAAATRTATMLFVHLDQPDPRLFEGELGTHVSGGLKVGERPFFERGVVITLEPDETHPVKVIASCNHHYVRWSLEASATAGGHRHLVEITNHGSPFETSGTPKGDFRERWEWAWHKQPPRFIRYRKLRHPDGPPSELDWTPDDLALQWGLQDEDFFDPNELGSL